MDNQRILAMIVVILAGWGIYLAQQDKFIPALDALTGGTPGPAPSVGATAGAAGAAADSAGSTASGSTAAPAGGLPSVTRWWSLIQQAAQQTGVPAALIAAIMQVESGGQPNVTNNNSNGTTDYGLMQVNQAYQRGLSNPFDPASNILAGAQELQQDLAAANGNYYTAARMYNAGIAGATKNPNISTNYAANVLGALKGYL